MADLKLGADPELFVKDAQGNISSVAGLLGCNKENKIDTGRGVRLQEDNVLIEFDIDPCTTFAQFNKLLNYGGDACQNAVAAHDLELAHGLSSYIFDEDVMDTFDDSAFEFGCSPDYNALNMRRFPKARATTLLRTAGGHVHMGWDHFTDVSIEQQRQVAVMCDYFLGLPSILLDRDIQRRELYGMAGSFRPKEYGIEYRVLSNFWLSDNANKRMVWDQTNKAFGAGTGDLYAQLSAIIDPQEVQRVINSGDTAMAEAYIKALEIA